jgi:3,4-dihydroxy 2-butanone 4-phosphate synthase / GTP cyclohydrolase II
MVLRERPRHEVDVTSDSAVGQGPFATIPEILEDLRNGKLVVLCDDEDRENEGDLCFAAEFATPQLINFLIRNAGGLICLAMAPALVDRLSLPMQSEKNDSKFGTAFTVSIEAKRGVSTGISAADRATTIRAAIADDASPNDLARPGHVFPLRAKEGGVLVRAGQTEGIVDLCRLAGLKHAGVICEILNEDGTMARVPDLERFCAKHSLKMGNIADLIEYRRRNEKLVRRTVSVKMPTRFGVEFDVHVYRSDIDDRPHLALALGLPAPVDGAGAPPIAEPVLVRVHSECLTGDVLGSMLCDCGSQLERALEEVAAVGRGVVLYIRQEGRGIGIENKLKAYHLQQTQGLDTVDANLALGFPADIREYGTGAQMLLDLGVRRIRLLTNNMRKYHALKGYGLTIDERVPLVIHPNPHNEKYLRTKAQKMGHDFGPPNDMSPPRTEHQRGE